MNGVVEARGLGKLYRIYPNPWDRFLGSLLRTGTPEREIWALRGIDISVSEGKCLGIIGANGAGKSTLLKLLTGVVQPTSGSLKMNGKVLALLELGTGFNDELTGGQNVIAVGTMLGYSREQIVSRLQAIRDFADIGEYFERQVKTYSSGMVMRLAFAFYISLGPEILIVDEALSVGDFFFQQKCATAMRELRAAGTTILLVSHDMAAVQELCDEAILLDHGRAVLAGDVSNVVGSYYMRASSRLNESGTLVPAGDTSDSATSNFAARIAEILRDDILGDSPSVGGPGASLLGLRLLNAAGSPAVRYRSGATMRMECVIKSHRAIACANFGLLMSDDGDRTVWSAATSNQQIWLEFQPGQTIIVTVDVVLALPPGRFHFNVATAEIDRFDPSAVTWNDTRLKAFFIDVVTAGDELQHRSGVAHLDMSVRVL